MAALRWSYESVSASVNESKIAQALPLRSVGKRISFLAASHPFVTAHTSYLLNQDLASSLSNSSGKARPPPVAISLTRNGYRHQCNNLSTPKDQPHKCHHEYNHVTIKRGFQLESIECKAWPITHAQWHHGFKDNFTLNVEGQGWFHMLKRRFLELGW